MPLRRSSVLVRGRNVEVEAPQVMEEAVMAQVYQKVQEMAHVWDADRWNVGIGTVDSRNCGLTGGVGSERTSGKLMQERTQPIYEA